MTGGATGWVSGTVRAVPFEGIAGFYRGVCAEGLDAVRWLCLRDRYFLATCVLGRADMANRWCFERCREVEAEPEGRLDLWSRFHFKSSIITQAGSIQEILRDPETTIGILSFNKATATAFVDQIRRELEKPALRELFPDILHQKTPKLNWSAEKGLIVKRRANPPEPTVFGSGLTDGQPVGRHFRLLIYDDVVTADAVTSPEIIRKTTDAWERSLALTVTEGGRSWYAGTRYHVKDTYAEILNRGVFRERRRLCVDAEGRPTLMSEAELAKIRTSMGSRTYAAQMMQEPTGEGVRYFKDGWLMFCDREPDRRALNVYIIIDSANGKRKNNDYTTMWVVGLGSDGNYYVLDIVRDRMDLVQRTEALFALHRKWRPLRVFWEQVGAMSDVQHVRDVQNRENYRFAVEEIPQSVPKPDRIGWLVPLFEGGRLWLPRRLLHLTVSGDTRDLVQDFISDEYSVYPVAAHDDMLDALANVKHPACAGMRFPKPPGERQGAAARSNSEWNPYGRD
jgi:predicted phage terminase large subunit-like protein